MSKITLNTIGSRYGGIDALNDNFAAIEDAFENTLSRDGSVPNSLEANLDINGHDLLNVKDLSMTGSLTVDGQDYLATAIQAAADAEDSADAAATSATSAASSATSATNSATSAANSVTLASSAASSASSSASSASTSATSAASSATSATSSASAASISATNASNSASAASTSASNASTSASNASTSATNAASSATAAASSATSAAASSAAALAALDSFDDRYLGQKASPPALDNDGNPLIVGALYFNTSGLGMQVWDGATWVALYSMGGGTVTDVTGTAPITSTGGATPAIGLAANYGDTQNPYASKTAKYVLAAPNGAAGTPSFRALVASDIPTLNQNTTGTAANVTGTVAVANGGTGATTAQGGINALAGAVTSGSYLRGNGTNVTMSTIQVVDVPTLNQNTTGTAANVTGTVAIANGGTGATTRQDAMDALAGAVTSGQYLRGNGTDVVMSAIQAADVPTLNQNTTGTAANVTGTVAIANGGTGKTTAPAAMANLMGYTTTATAAGTTTLTNTSSYYQVFTGTTTQTITLPVTSTLQTGWTFHICNNSTGNLTVNSSGAALVITVLPGTTVMVTCIGTTLTTAADWEAGYTDFSTVTGTGSAVLATSPTLVTPNIGVATGTSFNSITALSSTTPAAPGTAAVGTSTTVARADHVHAAQTTITGNAGTATTLATGRTLAITGDLTWTSPSFNGSANVTAAGTLANSGVTAGTYMSPKVTVDAKGRVTSAASAVFTSTDNFVEVTQTANGWDIKKYVFPVPTWYYIESPALGNLTATLTYPSNFSTTPSGSANMVAGAHANGSGWAFGFSSWSPAGSWDSTMQSNYVASSVSWPMISASPVTAWSTAPTLGIAFTYLQYPGASSNLYYADLFGSASSWNSGFGSSYAASGPPYTGSARRAYLVFMINGNAGVVSSSLAGATVVYAYNSNANKTYVFCEVTNNSSVTSILSGAGWISWTGAPDNYWGHAWVDYT